MVDQDCKKRKKGRFMKGSFRIYKVLEDYVENLVIMLQRKPMEGNPSLEDEFDFLQGVKDVDYTICKKNINMNSFMIGITSTLSDKNLITYGTDKTTSIILSEFKEGNITFQLSTGIIIESHADERHIGIDFSFLFLRNKNGKMVQLNATEHKRMIKNIYIDISHVDVGLSIGSKEDTTKERASHPYIHRI